MCTSSAPQGLHIFHYFTVCCDLSGMAARSRAVRERESVIEREREREVCRHRPTIYRKDEGYQIELNKIFKYNETLIYFRRGRLYQLLKYVILS